MSALPLQSLCTCGGSSTTSNLPNCQCACPEPLLTLRPDDVHGRERRSRRGQVRRGRVSRSTETKLPIETICSESRSKMPLRCKRRFRTAMTAQYIRIVAIPPGEAPLWVREKWVGLCLPVADDRGSRNAYVSGVLSGPPNRCAPENPSKQDGYAVYGRDAISELQKAAPDAAAWWRNHASRLLAPDRKLLFQTACCELVKAPCGDDNQGAQPFPRSIAKAAAVGLSSGPQIGMAQKVARISLIRSPFVPAVMLALFLVGGYLNWSHSVQPEQQATVHGDLKDWSVYNVSSKGGPHWILHLRMTGYGEEFRIELGRMGNRLPPGFAKGAALDITAAAAELASPLHPLFEPGVAIVWVNGLVVNGVTAFTVGEVVDHQKKQWIPWLMMVAMAAAYLAYTIMNSRKQRAGT